jgi:hypothetical protein
VHAKGSNRFAAISAWKKLTPVALPSGRAKFVTKPILTGSSGNAEDGMGSFGCERRLSVPQRCDHADLSPDRISH